MVDVIFSILASYSFTFILCLPIPSQKGKHCSRYELGMPFFSTIYGPFVLNSNLWCTPSFLILGVLFKTLVLTSASVRSVFDHRWQTPTPPLRNPFNPLSYLSHKLFWERIKTLLGDIKFFVWGNIHSDPGNSRPILDSSYLHNKSKEGEENKLSRIPTGHHKFIDVTSTPPKGNEKGLRLSVSATNLPPNNFTEI